MRLESCYPVLMLEDLDAAQAFFVRHFGFAPTFANEWYASLRHPEPPHAELAFVDPTHATIPAGHGAPARGLLVNVEVADATEAWTRLRDAAPVALALRDEPFGQRHFILVGPGGVLVDVIENIPPTAEFAAQFTGQFADPRVRAPGGHDG